MLRYRSKKLSRAEIEDLVPFLADPGRPDGTLCFQELQGVLFAVACSPELIPPPAWLAIISNERDIGFRDETEAQQIMGVIMSDAFRMKDVSSPDSSSDAEVVTR